MLPGLMNWSRARPVRGVTKVVERARAGLVDDAAEGGVQWVKDGPSGVGRGHTGDPAIERVSILSMLEGCLGRGALG